jgi:hypothetical protein
MIDSVKRQHRIPIEFITSSTVRSLNRQDSAGVARYLPCMNNQLLNSSSKKYKCYTPLLRVRHAVDNHSVGQFLRRDVIDLQFFDAPAVGSSSVDIITEPDRFSRRSSPGVIPTLRH